MPRQRIRVAALQFDTRPVTSSAWVADQVTAMAATAAEHNELAAGSLSNCPESLAHAAIIEWRSGLAPRSAT